VFIAYIILRLKSLLKLRFSLAVIAAYYLITLGLLIATSRYDHGWVDTRATRESIVFWQLGAELLLALVYYAYVSVSEELFFRVTLFEVLSKWGVKVEATVVVTGIVFGIAHFGDYFWAVNDVARIAALQNILFTTFSGILLGCVYVQRRNLLHVAFLHWLVWVSNLGARVVTGLLYISFL